MRNDEFINNLRKHLLNILLLFCFGFHRIKFRCCCRCRCNCGLLVHLFVRQLIEWMLYEFKLFDWSTTYTHTYSTTLYRVYFYDTYDSACSFFSIQTWNRTCRVFCVFHCVRVYIYTNITISKTLNEVSIVLYVCACVCVWCAFYDMSSSSTHTLNVYFSKLTLSKWSRVIFFCLALRTKCSYFIFCFVYLVVVCADVAEMMLFSSSAKNFVVQQRDRSERLYAMYEYIWERVYFFTSYYG